MRRALLVLLVPLCFVACPGPGGPDGGTGGGSGGSGGSGGNAGAFNIQTLDSQGGDRRWLAMAYDSANNRIGVAYFVNLGTYTAGNDGGMFVNDGGVGGGLIDYAIKYIEWKDGSVSPAQTIVPRVNVAIGITLAFQPGSGEPAVAFVGGGNEENSLVWLQNDLMLARRTGGASWNVITVTPNGMGYGCGARFGVPNAVSDGVQYVAGLWPALGFDSTGKGYLFWRNVHNGQFPVQDWQASDMFLEEISPGGAITHVCLLPGGNDKLAWGGRNMVVMAKDRPLVIGDHCDVNGPEAEGRDVYWMRLTDAGTWQGPSTAAPTPNAQTGATVAYEDDGGLGRFGLAVVNKGSDVLTYIQSVDDGKTWSTPDPVYGSGSGGWYPSVAFDPVNMEPAIAWYLCSLRTAVDESVCPAAEDALKVSQLIGPNWRTITVDDEGAWLPRLGFLKNGKRFVVYRSRGPGVLKLAIEK